MKKDRTRRSVSRDPVERIVAGKNKCLPDLRISKALAAWISRVGVCDVGRAPECSKMIGVGRTDWDEVVGDLFHVERYGHRRNESGGNQTSNWVRATRFVFMIEIGVAGVDNLEAVVHSVDGLFAEDAGTHDEHADVAWPDREGLSYYRDLVDDPAALLLVACQEDNVVGHLVGLLSESTPTRLSVRFAVLQSIRVEPELRGQGIGDLLTERFLDWGREQGCVQAVVTAYINNQDAQRFYERHGFAGRSLTSVADLR